jgi:UDP-glucose 4-epimerase
MNSRGVAVTGGAGFIGSHLSQELVLRGYRVTILDNLSTGKMQNIVHLINPINSTNPTNPVTQQTEFIKGSITDLPLLKKLFQGVDYVFHLAAIPSVPRSIENPLASHNVNITGTLNVLLAAKDNKVKKVIYASSSAVYGDTPTLPKREDMPPNPQSPYAVTKLAGEYYCKVFYEVFHLPTICLRYFNVYGPRQDPSSQYAAVIPRFIDRLFRDEPPIIFGNGEQTRDFTFVMDAAAANILATESDATGVFNIGTGKRVPINELARLITRIMGKDSKPIYQEPRPGDIRHSLADISKAKQFGYNPRYNLEEGLRETIKAMSKQSVMREE